ATSVVSARRALLAGAIAAVPYKVRSSRTHSQAGHMNKWVIAALVVFGVTTSRADESREITVFAAASLREALEDLAKSFEAKSSVKVHVNLAGSQELRTQIENGARADVFAAADQKHMDALVTAKLAGTPRVFARNTPVVIVPKGNPAKVGAFAELARAKKIVI